MISKQPISLKDLLGKPSKIQVNAVVAEWCSNKITKDEFINYLETTFLVEGIVSNVWNSIKSKVVDTFYTFVLKAYELGLNVYSKVSTFINWLVSHIKSFKQKHPTIFNIILVTLIVMVLLIVTASTAKAASTGQPIPSEKLNMAIGWLESMRGGKYDNMLLNKAMAHLIDLKDGNMDITTLGDKAIKTANIALDIANNMASESKEAKDEQLIQHCADLIEKGQSYIQAVYTKAGDSENIKLIVK